ncbi:hypothetical protein AVEN_12999-1, partial [Araneus ventricosus]
MTACRHGEVDEPPLSSYFLRL